MSKTLYRKYRPKKFSDVLGQDHIIQTLQNAISSNRISHAYIFTGPRGTGKTSVARLFATAINTEKRKDFTPVAKDVAERLRSGNSMDIIEIDAASSTSVEGIRSLKETVSITPSEAFYKVYIIDEVHMLSTSAFNALLKTLEEPPAHVVFILATTEIHKVPETILSRCQRFDFSRFSVDTITKKLHTIAKNEKIEISQEALEMIAITANGGMRDAESLLAQVFALNDKNITAKEVSQILGSTTSQDVIDIVTAFTNKNLSQSLFIIEGVVKNGQNIETFIRSLIEKLRILLFLTLNIETNDLQKLITAPKSEIQKFQEIAKDASYTNVLNMIEECTIALQKTKNTTIPRLPIEVAAITICGSMPKKDELQKEAPGEPDTPKPAEKKDQKTFQKNDKNPAQKIAKNVERLWHKSIEKIEEDHKSIGAILSECLIEKFENDQFFISTKNSFYQEKLLQSNNRTAIEGVLSTCFEKRMKITVTVSKDLEKNPTSELLSYATQLMGGTVTES